MLMEKERGRKIKIDLEIMILRTLKTKSKTTNHIN